MGRRYRNYNRYTYYEKTTPIEVDNGIALTTQRGDVVEHWWSKKWIAYLKSLNMGARLTRGKAYARKGQTLSVDIIKGKVIAKVQGSYREPYTVEIKLKAILKSQWKKIIKLLASQAIYGSKLLNGKMPQDIEKIFTKAGVELFPSSRSDLQTECSCPDYVNPCKHIAAVYYILAEKFDENPFLIFELRGKSKEDFITMLRESRTETAIDLSAPPENIPLQGSNIHTESEVALFEKGEDYFWRGEKAKYVNSISLSPSNLNAELLAKIEPSPINLENRNLADILRKTYSSLTDLTLERINQSFKFDEDERTDEKAESFEVNPQSESDSDLQCKKKKKPSEPQKKSQKRITTQKINSIMQEKDADQKWVEISTLLAPEDIQSKLSQKSLVLLVKGIESLIFEWMEYGSNYRPDNSIVSAILTIKKLSSKGNTKNIMKDTSKWDSWFHKFWQKHFRYWNLKVAFRSRNLSPCKVAGYWTLLDMDKDVTS